MTTASTASRPTTATSPWRVSRHGVRVVAGVEVRRLLRSKAWLVAVVVWAVVITSFTLLLLGSVGAVADDVDSSAVFLFGLVAYGVLALGGLVAPALSATSINAERRDGTLATWQATLLTPAEIATGKLAAGWLAAIALVAAATPAILLTFVAAPGMGFGRVLTTLGIVTLTLLVVVTMGLGMSAVLLSPIASTVVTYLLVVALGVGGPILFGLTTALIFEDVEVVNQEAVRFDPVSSRPLECEPVITTERQPRTDRTWGLLAGSPFVILADAAPRLTDERLDSGSFDMLGGISTGVRQLRLGPTQGFDACAAAQEAADQQAARDALAPVWGWGVLFLVALAAGSWVLAVRRLIVPVRRLPPGMRIA